MMITRNVVGLAGISLCLLLGGASAVNASTVTEKAVGKKLQTLKLSENKAHHPCARKSAASLNKKAAPYLQSIHIHSKKYGVDHDLVKSVITIESCYRQKALSPKGAQGLMQLIPATAERFGVSNVYDTDQNVRGGTKYLSWLSKRFNGDLQKVLAGYNAGEGRVDQYNGIPPFRETRNYVHDVLLVYKKLKAGKQQMAKKVQEQTAQEAAKKQAQLALEHKKQRLARQRQVQLAEQKRLAAMTPAQRQRAIKQAQLAQKIRQRQQSERQKQLVAQMRQRQQTARQKQLVQQVRQQEKRRAVLSGDQPSQTHQIVTGQMSSPIKAQAPRPQAPVLRKVSKKVVRNADGTQVVPQKTPGRVQRTYTSPFKPGRGGREANKRLAPQLYKQQ